MKEANITYKKMLSPTPFKEFKKYAKEKQKILCITFRKLAKWKPYWLTELLKQNMKTETTQGAMVLQISAIPKRRLISIKMSKHMEMKQRTPLLFIHFPYHLIRYHLQSTRLMCIHCPRSRCSDDQRERERGSMPICFLHSLDVSLTNL